MHRFSQLLPKASRVGAAAVTVFLTSSLLATPAGAAPQHTVTTTLTFASDCSSLVVDVAWTGWRTTLIVLSIEDPTNNRIGSNAVVYRAPADFKASRSGSTSAR